MTNSKRKSLKTIYDSSIINKPVEGKILMEKESPEVIDDAVSNIVIAPISSTHLELSVKIAERCLGVREPDLREMSFDPRKFSGGEYCPRFRLRNGDEQTLKGKTVYELMLPGPYKSPEELVQRACIAARAAKENGAEKVVLLASDLPHARQDRGPSEDKNAVGEANTVRWNARQFEAAGIDQVLTTHEHSPRIAAFFALEYGLIPREKLSSDAPDKPREIRPPKHFDPSDPEIQQIGRTVFKSISPHAILADYILHHSWLAETFEGRQYLKDFGAKLALKALDKGNRHFRDSLYDSLFMPNAVKVDCDKARKAKNDRKKVEVPIVRTSDNFETLDGMLEILADDGLDTGGTMIKSVEWSNEGNRCAETGREYGTPLERFVYFTHAWLGGDAHQLVQERLVKGLPTREFVTTNCRPYVGDSQYHRFKALSTVLRFAGLWGDAIVANELGHDVMTRYQDFDTEVEQHEFIKNLYILKRHSRHFLISGTELKGREIKFYLRD